MHDIYDYKQVMTDKREGFYTLTLDLFDPAAICESGQIFRMYDLGIDKNASHVYEVFSGNRRLEIHELADKTEENCGEKAADSADRGKNPSEGAGALKGRRFMFSCSREEFEGYWRHYFDLDRDYGRIVRSACCSTDGFLKCAAEYGQGIRVLNQNIWEMMISFIISQQKQIPEIRKSIEKLCARYGEKHPEGWCGFPSPQAIAAGGPEGLKGLSLGYRERYIYETSIQYLDHGVSDETLKKMDYTSAMRYLTSFSGIGEKVANCVCLFGAEFSDAFPVDVHIKDILHREYYHGSTPKEKLTMKDYNMMVDEAFVSYIGVRGIVQQWIFAYERLRK